MSTTKPVETFAPTFENSDSLREYVVNSFSGRMPKLIDFMLSYKTTMELVKNLTIYTTKSTHTLYNYGFSLKCLCDFTHKNPDELVAECLDGGDGVRLLEDFVGYLKAKDLAPGTVADHVKGVRSFFRANDVDVKLKHKLPKWKIVSDRAPKPDEIKILIDVADLREKVVVSLLALGGFRVGTLEKLQYRHIKHDLEAGIVPIHVHVEADITKGKYGEYDTFIGKEGADFLKAYFDQRKRGTPKVPPETIDEKSPLIRSARTFKVVPVSSERLSQMVWNLYIRAGLIEKRDGRRHDLVAHSLRKYFRTQLGAVPSDYVEYMMGHRISVYHDIESKGIEFLRSLYAGAGLSLGPKPIALKLDTLKALITAWGENPEKYLSKEALSMPHRAHLGPTDFEEWQSERLSSFLRDLIKNDLGRCI